MLNVQPAWGLQSQPHGMLSSDSKVHTGWAACCKLEFCMVWLRASSKASVCPDLHAQLPDNNTADYSLLRDKMASVSPQELM